MLFRSHWLHTTHINKISLGFIQTCSLLYYTQHTAATNTQTAYQQAQRWREKRRDEGRERDGRKDGIEMEKEGR